MYEFNVPKHIKISATLAHIDFSTRRDDSINRHCWFDYEQIFARAWLLDSIFVCEIMHLSGVCVKTCVRATKQFGSVFLSTLFSFVHFNQIYQVMITNLRILLSLLWPINFNARSLKSYILNWSTLFIYSLICKLNMRTDRCSKNKWVFIITENFIYFLLSAILQYGNIIHTKKL